MGNFLTAPITDKETKTGEGHGLCFGISAMQGWRTNMEDAHVAVSDFERFPEGCSVFAVFDGHGGKLAADMAAAAVAEAFADAMHSRGLFSDGSSALTGDKMPTPELVGDCMREAYMKLDAKIREAPEVQYGSDQSGCTALSAFVTNAHIVVANSGDSRSVLAKGGRTKPMSYDHKPMNEEERKRIERAGGMVRANRVNGDLAVSRALGDFTYKQRNDLTAEEQQVSAEPDILIESRDGTEEFLIIACDGIWDVMSNDNACNHVRMLMNKGERDMGLIAEDILDECLLMGSRDNMSVIVVQFPGATFGTGEGVAGVRAERKRLEAEALAKQQEIENQMMQGAGASASPGTNANSAT